MNRSAPLRLIAALLLCLALTTLLPAAMAESLPAAEQTASVLTLSEKQIVIDLASSSRHTISASLTPADSSARYSYSSSDTRIARVSSRGVITGRRRGTCTITVRQRGGEATAQCTVTVKDSRVPQSITFVQGTSATLERYETLQLTAQVMPASADQRVAWKSSARGVATVSSKGLVTAKRGGTAVITCYSRRDRTVLGEITVTVKEYPTPTAISLEHEPHYMIVGTTLQLHPQTEPAGQRVCEMFTWRSSSSRRASVSASGLVTAKSTGVVTITCSSKQNSRIRETLRIVVVKPDSPYYITLTPGSETINAYAGDTLHIGASVFPANRAQGIVWKSSRTSVATVDQNGNVTVKRPGTVKITATSSVNRDIQSSVTIRATRLPAPDAITLSPMPATLEVSDTLALSAQVYPTDERRSREFRWKTSSSSIARVSSDGVVTPRRLGTVTITCYSAVDSDVRATLTLRIVDSKMPDKITLNAPSLSMEDGQKIQLTPTIEPATATQTVSWKSSKTRVATVDSNGVVTAHAAGTAYITATSTHPSAKSVRIQVTVTQKAAPSALSFPTSVASIYVGKSAQIAVQPQPANASVMCRYVSSDPSIASVDQNGIVTTHKTGIVTISARSLKNSHASASVRVIVYDDNTPGAVNLESASLYLGLKYGDYLRASVFPATASQTIVWSSANPNIATVDNKGYIYGKAIGTTTVTATAVNGVSASCTVYVTSTNVSGVIPARTTTISGIPENLGKIYAIQDSALDVIASLNALGAISGSEAGARSAIIRRAMADQAFPWMTLSTQEYWTQKYAEKRYLPGRVYYGLPYTQAGANGNSANRTYTAAKALTEKRYYDSNQGYYILNQKNLLNGSYAGCDCSFFVNSATYGINHPAAALKTYTMNTSNYYKTLRSYSELRPGDHIVLAKSHTVMFLYWMDAEKTKFMIIEQGGDGNTIICSIKNASEYASKGYIPRRVSSFS